MTDHNYREISTDFSNVNLNPTVNNNIDVLETAEEACTSDNSNNYLSGSYRCEKFKYSSSSDSNLTITPPEVNVANVVNNGLNSNNNLQIPIVGYEVMEERARFTVYKLRIENKSTGDCWYVFRRYTDFVRLCSRLKKRNPELAILMPSKKWFGNNFDPTFLEERIQRLQEFINAIIVIPELISNSVISDFFCLNEPPVYSDTTEESRAIFEALEDTIYHLRNQVHAKESIINKLQKTLNNQMLENGNLKTLLKNATGKCTKCQEDYENGQGDHYVNLDNQSTSKSSSSKE